MMPMKFLGMTVDSGLYGLHLHSGLFKLARISMTIHETQQPAGLLWFPCLRCSPTSTGLPSFRSNQNESNLILEVIPGPVREDVQR